MSTGPVGILAGSNQCSPGDLMQKEALPLPPTLPSFRKEKEEHFCFPIYVCFMALEPVIRGGQKAEAAYKV